MARVVSGNRRPAPQRVESSRYAAPPSGYRPFSPKAPASLVSTGGLLTALGGLGAAIRATRLAGEREQVEQAALIMGHAEAAGWLLAALGVALAALGLLWTRRGRVLRAATLAMSIAAIAAVAVRVTDLNDRATALAARQAGSSPEFLAYHAGLGWGAWTALLGAVLLSFGVLVAALRALDVRRGMSG